MTVYYQDDHALPFDLEDGEAPWITEQDWVDEVAVERGLSGKPIGRSLTEAERRHIADQVVSQGKGIHAISRATRCNAGRGRQLYADAVERAEQTEGGAAA